jgi:hypothetical protein
MVTEEKIIGIPVTTQSARMDQSNGSSQAQAFR